jgi:hypothetical protein
MEAIEDASWRKGSLPRKTFAAHSAVQSAPRMIAPSMSAHQHKTISSAGDQLRPEDVVPVVFMGRNMTIYENDVAIESNGEEIRTEVATHGE